MNTAANPNNYYLISAQVVDADKLPIGSLTKVSAAAPVNFDTKLPLVLVITLSNNPNGFNNDAQPVQFAYGGQNWDSSQSPQCNMGAYDSGVRQGDCTWQCP